MMNGQVLSAMLALLAASGINAEIVGYNDPLEKRQEPINQGRRAEKDLIALKKAEENRARKKAKRLENLK